MKNTLTNKDFFQIRNWITRHPTSSLSELAEDLSLPSEFLEQHTICLKCGHIEKTPLYAIAQTGMGHSIEFTCQCGNKIDL